ncbi:DUF4240 domain-containing protein [Kitasatospora sp. RG8]|uniref:DUF4240 domain-containing protein n=1 Tax=Kitasatospora sp. RG8 TaxID=2820815 RepID=UPI001ADFED0D|nr:DUF4240 domain-containing protein [Kitasatospora sp. RG8]MBP0449161.1 DUF4240 domain-containing protein [Kitasatospora sp. RG8]
MGTTGTTDPDTDSGAGATEGGPGAVGDLPVITWARFWELIGILGGPAGTSTCDDVETGCERLTEVLAAGPVGQIIGFGERLAEALYRLDQEEFGTLPVTGMERPGGEPFAQSDDGFLYARAAVVAAGRAVYESVFGEPDRFAPFTARHCEELLYVHEDAYEQATGEEWDRLTRYDYESCSNRDGWPGPGD